MIVKICGLMKESDADPINSACPDWAGFVFHPGSRRCISSEQAAILRSSISADIPTVAVVVDRDPDFVEELVKSGTVDMIQVHACKDESYFRRIADIGVPTIRAFVVRSEKDIQEAASSESDYILLDAGMGSGQTFEWSLLEDAGFPFILSGGLDPANVADAVRRTRPLGVDVSSGVETNGTKDPEKIRAFIDAARSTS